MTKGSDISTQERAGWKKPYAECFSQCSLSETRRASLRQLIRNEPLEPVPSFVAPHAAASLASAVLAPPPRRASVLARMHRSGVGYVAAAAAVFGVYSLAGGKRPDAPPLAPVVDSGVLRYARVLPADFDLEGDAAALPSVVSEVTGGDGPSEEPFELRLPDSLRHVYVPREGRFFTLPSGKLAVAIQMRPQRAGAGKPKTLFLMPHQRAVDDVLPQNNMARFVNLSSGGASVSSGDRSNAWRNGGLNYMLMDE
ncbi:MAG: hypothetical protein IOD12_01535 [Silvanigrellales bacterium]|jgi:hypothetical protein|nr:hypothetical protein [Silvanigrellales bacterium]